MSGARQHPWLVLILTCFIVATATDAQAQSWLADRKRAEGMGIRLGNFELHPGLGAEFGWISNVYNAEPEQAVPSAAMRLAPHLFLSTLGSERSGADQGEMPGIIDFRGGLSATLFHYFADGAPKRSTDFGTDVNLQFTLAPNRPVSFSLIEIFSRWFQPFADPANEPSIAFDPERDKPLSNFARYSEVIGAHLDGRTSGGLLTAGLGYRLAYQWFEDDVYATNNNLVHTVDLKGAWAFLPKSVLFYDGMYMRQTYPNRGPTESDPTRLPLTNNDQVSARIGFNGAITSRISATLAVGYAVGFFNGTGYDGLTLNAEGRWLPTPISELGLGYERAFSSAYLGNYVMRNQVYLRLRHFFGGAIVVGSKLAVEFLDFGADPLQSPEARSDIRYSADVNGEYRFTDWLAVTAQAQALIDSTDFVTRAEVETPEGTRIAEDPAEFKRFELWIGLRAFY
jgi:hypothetical protein